MLAVVPIGVAPNRERLRGVVWLESCRGLRRRLVGGAMPLDRCRPSSQSAEHHCQGGQRADNVHVTPVLHRDIVGRTTDTRGDHGHRLYGLGTGYGTR